MRTIPGVRVGSALCVQVSRGVEGGGVRVVARGGGDGKGGQAQGRQELRRRLRNLFGLSMQYMYDNLCRGGLALAVKSTIKP